MTAPERPADCLFCKIVDGDIPAEIVRADETTVAFRDLEPQAPVHVLVVPRSHYATVADLAHHESASVADLVRAGAAVAASEGLDSYRSVFNSGAEAGQSVFHVHLHVLGGRPMSWPPG